MSASPAPAPPLRPAPRRVDPAGGQDVRTRPLLRVVRGDPSAEELAALIAVVAVVAARASTAAEPQSAARPVWGRPVLRPTATCELTPGPGAWRACGLPR